MSGKTKYVNVISFFFLKRIRNELLFVSILISCKTLKPSAAVITRKEQDMTRDHTDFFDRN